MSEFTRRLTWPEEDRPHDWTIVYRGAGVARYYSDRHKGQERWQWFTNLHRTWDVEGLPERGIEDSEEACQDALRKALEQYLAAGALKGRTG